MIFAWCCDEFLGLSISSGLVVEVLLVANFPAAQLACNYADESIESYTKLIARLPTW